MSLNKDNKLGLTAFKKAAEKVAQNDDLLTLPEDRSGTSINLNQPGQSRKTNLLSKSPHKGSPNLTASESIDHISRSHSRDSSLGEGSSFEASETDLARNDRKKGLFYQKTENFYTRIRDMIGQSDVFIARNEKPPFVTCVNISLWIIPVIGIFNLWDTLAICAFQLPHFSGISHPGFLLCWSLLITLLAMYGFMLSYLCSGASRRTKLAAISLGVHTFFLLYRIFLEMFFDGFRGQRKLYFVIAKIGWG